MQEEEEEEEGEKEEEEEKQQEKQQEKHEETGAAGAGAGGGGGERVRAQTLRIVSSGTLRLSSRPSSQPEKKSIALPPATPHQHFSLGALHELVC